ncbi:hypothetical protein RA272_30565, partial [Pseudomonas syringae pv. tagetis]|uniref:hypothetical protein n=1 Tax=Pseudomonas syringae group genomosp. 7 TaxID=251699 RepID=UPI00376F7924
AIVGVEVLAGLLGLLFLQDCQKVFDNAHLVLRGVSRTLSPAFGFVGGVGVSRAGVAVGVDGDVRV